MDNTAETNLVTIQLEELQLTVDLATAEAIHNDPIIAQNYLAMARQLTKADTNTTPETSSCFQQIPSPQEPAVESTLWKSSKHPSKTDNEATLALIALRKQFHHQFLDKKTAKNGLWTKIAQSMNEMGYYVGQGTDAREKCRQKFSNLQASYMKTVDRRRRTGEGAVITPPYFEELSDIFGDSHKANPVLLIDSIGSSSNTSSVNSISEENLTTLNTSNNITEGDPPTLDTIDSDTPSTSSGKSHRYNKIRKTVRPKKGSHILDILVAINSQNQETRKEEFKTMINLMQEQNLQRHNQVLALIASLKTNQKGKKRSRSPDSDE